MNKSTATTPEKQEDSVTIVDTENRGHVVIVEVEAIIDGKKHTTNFNFPPDMMEGGRYKKTIRRWVADIKKTADLKDLPAPGTKITL